jgi:hypothetical protein
MELGTGVNALGKIKSLAPAGNGTIPLSSSPVRIQTRQSEFPPLIVDCLNKT